MAAPLSQTSNRSINPGMKKERTIGRSGVLCLPLEFVIFLVNNRLGSKTYDGQSFAKLRLVGFYAEIYLLQQIDLQQKR